MPCYIVKADAAEAASIFAAVNGNVTPMTPPQVYKAALAAGAEWALALQRACDAAGVKPLTYVMSKRSSPRSTMAIGSMREILTRFGEKVLAGTLALLAKAVDADAHNFFNSARIKAFAGVLNSRPGWLAKIDEVGRCLPQTAIALMEVENVVHHIIKKLGDGRMSGDALAIVSAKVLDLHERKFNAGMIAATLRMQYIEVETILKTAGLK